MRVAYLDTSALVAILFGESSASAVQTRLNATDEVLSSNLLEAELRAAFAREKVAFDDAVVGGITWVLPQRGLGAELSEVLAAGYLRGADLWHVACALYVAGDHGQLTFLTMDAKQREIAGRLGLDIQI